MPLRNKLKEYRARADANQSELGKMVGVSRQTISQIERGDCAPSVALALRLAKVLDASVEDLFFWTGTRKSTREKSDGSKEER